MASESFELDSVDLIAAASVGDPGQRQFFLLATGAGRQVTLRCEKFHVQGLVTRARQLLEEKELSEGTGIVSPVEPAVGEVDWAVGELGLGYHDSKGQFVVVAREAEVVSEAEPKPEPATARIWVSPEQVRSFVEQAERVLSAGRPTCQHCGLPVDPAGHPCPASNGSRPIF